MPQGSQYLQHLIERLRKLREDAGISPIHLEDKLILGPGWITRFESGEITPSLDMLLAILHSLGKNLSDLLQGLPQSPSALELERNINAEQQRTNLLIHFRYANYDATYTLPSVTIEQFSRVIKTLRDGLSRLTAADAAQSEAIKTDSVAQAFLAAVKQWPHANPSDLWWFVIYRAYCDPFNHPARFARLDLQQSWKRTGGWALEQVLCRHYGPFLQKHGIGLSIHSLEVKEKLLKGLKIRDRLEAAKVDVVLTGIKGGKEVFFGVVHVKASFAERRTDDVPMSRALVKAGYISPLWTMDCKSMPSENPTNKGELGVALSKRVDRRSAKRKDIEDDGYFSACFSYNSNTLPTPSAQKAKARVHICNFNNPNDIFSQFIIAERLRLQKS